MSRPRWFVTLLKKAYPTRFVAARSTRLPLWGRLVEHLLFDGDRMVYLPPDQVIPVGEEITVPDEMVLPSQVVAHFVRAAETRWIMDRCICRDAENCRDYPIDLGCLFLGEAAAGISPKLGRPVTEAEALDHVARAREAGLVHIIGRNKLDTVWLGVGPGQRLMTICHCCPCCCLYGILPHLAPHIGAKVTAMPGVHVEVTDVCIGCGICTQDVCFVEAIRLVGGRAEIGAGCRGCGRCVELCPQGAIELRIEEEAFVSTVIAELSAHVDVGGSSDR
ncbi:MAG: 4Fe-4S binding protein [Anaerolineae bacterium]|jgi:ferredoxin